MGAIVLDTNKVNSYVLPNLNKSESTMQTAYNTSASVRNSLPGSFAYRSMANDIVNQIYNLKREIRDINSIIQKKVEKANQIQRKADSGVGSLAAAVARTAAIGAKVSAKKTVGSAVVSGAAAATARAGAAVATGATSGVASGMKKTGAKQSKSVVSKVKGFFVKAWKGIKNTAAKIAKAVKSVWEKFSGAIKNIGKAVVDATKSVGKTIYKAGAKVVKSTVSAVKKVGSAIVKGFKWVGSKVVSGVKTAAKWVKEKAKTATNWLKDKFKAVKDWTCKAIKNTGAWISKTAKATWSWLKNAGKTVWKHMKKIGASFVNGVLSLVKGLVSLVEAIGDLALLLVSGIGTIGTALYDIGKGLFTGKWDWSATKGLWKITKAAVTYDWTSKCIFDPLYNTKFGKWLDNNAYGWFKSDGIGCKILEGIGYVAGVVAISVVTCGAGGVAIAGTTISTTTAMTAIATAAGIGKYTAEEWNKNCLSITYGGQELGLTIDYQKYREIEKLKEGQSTTIKQQLMGEDGKPIELVFTITKTGNTYSIVDSNGNAVGFNGVKESSTVKGLIVGTVKGGWEGFQYYVGGKIGTAQFTSVTGKMTSPVVKTLTRSGMRVGLDMLTGAAEVPFQSAVTMFSEGKSWDEAWDANGGWTAVQTQVGIAGIASFAGEAFSFKGNLGTEKVNTALISGDTQSIDNVLKNSKPQYISSAIQGLDDIKLKNIFESGTFENLDNVSKANLLNSIDNKKIVNIIQNSNLSDEQMGEIWNNLDPRKYTQVSEMLFDSKGVKTINPNSIDNYKFNLKKELKEADSLRKANYTDEQIVDNFTKKASEVSNIQSKYDLEDFTYEYLLKNGKTPEEAAQMIAKSQWNQINARGMDTIHVDTNGIKYNVIGGYNPNNQAYKLNYILNEIENLPDSVKSKIKEINIYDTNNPWDKYWTSQYNNYSGKYFKSAATAGDGTINIWANDFVSDSTIAHEAGHCLDANFIYSSSDEYLAAMKADFEYNGKLGITTYAENASCEDFADSLSAYLKGKIYDGDQLVDINNFPNRKAYFDKLFSNVSDTKNLNIDTQITKNTSNIHNTVVPSSTLTKSTLKNLENTLQNDNIFSVLNGLKSLDESQFDFLIKNIDSINNTNSNSNFLKKMVDIYNEGMVASQTKYKTFFQNFREHGIKHSTNVSEYAVKIAKQMDDVNLDEVAYASFIHDFGMRGGYMYVDDKLAETILKSTGISNLSNKYIKIDSLQNYKIFEFNKYTGKVEWSKDFLDSCARKNHPLNSALSVLTDNDILPDTVDKDVVALLAMTHSKSTSGIRHFSSTKEWSEAVDKLDAALKQYNLDNKTLYSFDAKRIKAMIDNKTDFTRLQKEALAIRDGDAMADVVEHQAGKYKGTLMQDGTISVVKTNEVRDFNTKVLSSKEEYSMIIDEIYDSNGNKLRELGITHDELFSKKVHIGEANLKFDSSYIDGKYKATINIKDANQTPNATFSAIEERIGEVNTYTNCESRSFEIVLPENAKGTELGKWYEDSLEKLKYTKGEHYLKFDADTELGKKIITKEEFNKQLNFYENIKIVYRDS